MDRPLSVLRLLRPSLHTNRFAISELVSYPSITDLDTQLRIAQSLTLLLYSGSIPDHVLVSQTHLVVKALRGFLQPVVLHGVNRTKC